MRNIAPAKTQQFIDKADHFFHAMRLVAMELPVYRSGIALLAVHSAISLNDAITAAIQGNVKRRPNHLAAVAELEAHVKSHRIGNIKGIAHFRWLLMKKTSIAYERYRLDDATIHMSVDHAERFHAWAYNYFKEILNAQTRD